jgi:phosphonopyruvate decarboxylase
MIDAADMVADLIRRGFGPFVGVPCSLLAPLFSDLAGRGAMLMATEEGEAIGLAAGMWLAGAKPVVLMQNAGFLNALNPLLSLHAVFELPLLLVLSHRGKPGTEDAPEHEHSGRLTLPLLDLAGITHETVSAEDGDMLVATTGRAAEAVDSGGRHALLVARGTFREQAAADPIRPRSLPVSEKGLPGPRSGRRIRRGAILATLFARLPDAVFVASTGFIAREAVAASARTRACVFPVIGSMGCAGPVGLGLALSAPQRRVVVLDGDGALLMKLGALATVASHAPTNLLHVVFNDGVYASTGGQANAAGLVSLARLAHAARYATSVRAETVADLEAALSAAADVAGPHMVEAATTFEPSTEAPRLGEPPASYARHLRELRLGARLDEHVRPSPNERKSW